LREVEQHPKEQSQGVRSPIENGNKFYYLTSVLVLVFLLPIPGVLPKAQMNSMGLNNALCMINDSSHPLGLTYATNLVVLGAQLSL